MLTIIVPVRNEIDNIKGIINYFLNNLADLNFEVLIINDFSTDNTFSRVKELIKEKNNFKILNNKKKGLGGAINLGIKESRGAYITIMMADESDDIQNLLTYENLIKTENYDAIMGSRFLKNSKIINYPIQKLVLNRLFNLFKKKNFKLFIK